MNRDANPSIKNLIGRSWEEQLKSLGAAVPCLPFLKWSPILRYYQSTVNAQ